MNNQPPHAGRWRRLGAFAASTLLLTALGAPLVIPASAAGAQLTGFGEIDRLPFSVGVLEGEGDTATEFPSALLVDHAGRKAYSIIGGRTANNEDVVHLARHNLDAPGFPIEQAGTVPRATLPNANTVENGVVATLGGGHLYFADLSQRVHKVNTTSMARVAAFAPPMPTTATATDPVLPLVQDLLWPLVFGEDAPPSDGDTRSITHRRPVSFKPVNIGALTYLDAVGTRGPKLYVLTESPTSGDAPETPQVVAISQWDATNGNENWVAHLEACRNGRGAQSSKYGMGFTVRMIDGANADAVVGCIGRGTEGEIWKVSLKPGDHLQPLGAQQKVGSVPAGLDFFPDPASDKMYVQTAGTASGQSIIGVDLKRRGVYGVVSASHAADGRGVSDQVVSAGVDPTTGRIYVAQRRTERDGRVNKAGVVLIDGRRQPMPQGNLDETANPSTLARPNGRVPLNKIAVDPASGSRPTRVFIRFKGEPFFRVFEDRVPVQKNIPIGDVDRFTIDRAEEEGVTRAAFNATTSSYGLRALFNGGLYSGIPNLTNVGSASWPQDPLKLNTPFQCQETQRELILASMVPGGTGLSDTGTTATASPAEADVKTRQELAEPVASCWIVKGLIPNAVDQALADNPDNSQQPSDQAWTLVERAFDIIGREAPERPTGWPSSPPDQDRFDDGDGNDESDLDEYYGQTVRDPFPFSEAQCSLPGTKDASPHAGDNLTVTAAGVKAIDRPIPGFVAGAICDASGRSISAFAGAARHVEIANLASIEGTATSSVIEWGAKGGATVTTTSVVDGIKIAGVLQIGQISNTVTSTAAGRPGTATATIKREMCGVVGLGVNRQGCLDLDSPQAAALINGLSDNLLERRNIEIRIPAVDDDLRTGTPGGALSALQKDRFTAEGERLLNNDSRTVVPAIEVQQTNDSLESGRSRYIVQFAGGETSTAYNISLQPPSFDFNFDLPDFELPASELALPTITSPGQPATPAVPARVLAANASADSPNLGSLPTPGGLVALGNGLRWLLRNPWQALKIAMLIFTAWGIPAHLLERRRTLAATIAREV